MTQADNAAPKEEEASVPADPSQPTCALSGERFDSFWDDATNGWRYKGATALDAEQAARYRSALMPATPDHANCQSRLTASTLVLGSSPNMHRWAAPQCPGLNRKAISPSKISPYSCICSFNTSCI